MDVLHYHQGVTCKIALNKPVIDPLMSALLVIFRVMNSNLETLILATPSEYMTNLPRIIGYYTVNNVMVLNYFNINTMGFYVK